MVGKTPPIRKKDKQRFETIKMYCGCLPCLLLGHLDRHTTIEHVTESGRRIGRDSEQHQMSIGLCEYHHFGRYTGPTQKMIGNFGPCLAFGRRDFEEFFGDENHVLIPTQDFMLSVFEKTPWPEYSVPRHIARDVRIEWIDLKHAANSQFIEK